jgi:RNA polymerase sigma factor (sigma-70 family)
MPSNRLEQLWAAIPLDAPDPRGDAELLARFLDHQDQAAFEALLVRHTPAVRAACWGWLRSTADVDDAAQATFLVLVQRAGSIREQSALGRWLYRVAINVARRLRRQRRTAFPLPEDLPALEPSEDRELRDLLDEEVARLPEKYRLPVQLCYSGGLSTAEAAQWLGWPKGTVLTRLAWARERLKKSLAQRGVSPTLLTGFTAKAAMPLAKSWLDLTVLAAKSMLAGESPAAAGVSQRTVALTEGVVRAMMWDRMKYVALTVLLVIGGVGFGIHLWASGSDGPGKAKRSPGDTVNAPAALQREGKDNAPGVAPAGLERDTGKAGEGRGVRRREAIIRLPAGTFVKEIDVKPYGSGRLTWTYEDERVVGLLEGSVMGGEFEVATEAEYSLSSNGTIYGLINSVQINHLRLPEGGKFEELRRFEGLWTAAEPLVSEVFSDLPFSYRFRVQGNRLIISNFRMLLAGPNPLGKLGALFAGDLGVMLGGFQVLATAVEGTYTAEGKEKPAPGKRRPIFKPRSRSDASPNQ